MWIGFGWALVAMLVIAGLVLLIGVLLLVVGLARLVGAERWRARMHATRPGTGAR